MKHKKRNIKLYLQDILDCLEKIERYTERMSFTDFLNDDKTKDSVVRNLEVIGEATKNIPDVLKERYATIPWDDIAGMRNKIAHEYFGINYDVVWHTLKDDLPDFGLQIAQIIREVE
ncbi:MAG: DUF86 domain-containing protein [Ignavibacteriales bacterium]|nr:DUF86 domain-containing protein [Ignavibacteriales bacterium]